MTQRQTHSVQYLQQQPPSSVPQDFSSIKSVMSGIQSPFSSSSSLISPLHMVPSSTASCKVDSAYMRYQNSLLSNTDSTEYQAAVEALQTQNSSISSSCGSIPSSSEENPTGSKSSFSSTTASNAAASSKSRNSTKMDLYQYLNPAPASPPNYRSINVCPKISYPVYEHEESNVLPDYSPAIHEVTLVLRKLEWLSPYEPSPIRSWRNLIMELNSTQLNFYSIENIPLLNRVKKSKTRKYYDFTPIETEFIVNDIKKNPSVYFTNKRLVKSYSLQYAKFGIPVEYRKKNNCLRLRAETDQFLIHFTSIDDMLKWSNYLAIGINVSLDLDSRPMPTDRTVPRRRRNRRSSSSNRHRSYSDSELIRRELSPQNGRKSSFSGNGSIKKKITKLFSRRHSESGRDITSSLERLNLSGSNDNASSNTDADTPTGVHEFEDDSCGSSRPSDDSNDHDISTIHEVDEEEVMHDNDEVHSLGEIHDDSDDESFHENNDLFNDFSFDHDGEGYSKEWNPEPKVISRRKFLKDSIRCIRLLPADEQWCGYLLVRYLNPPHFKTCNHIESKNAKNKFLKTFMVGPQGLIACVN